MFWWPWIIFSFILTTGKWCVCFGASSLHLPQTFLSAAEMTVTEFITPPLLCSGNMLQNSPEWTTDEQLRGASFQFPAITSLFLNQLWFYDPRLNRAFYPEINGNNLREISLFSLKVRAWAAAAQTAEQGGVIWGFLLLLFVICF